MLGKNFHEVISFYSHSKIDTNFKNWKFLLLQLSKCTFILLNTTLNLKACKVNNGSGASAESKKMQTFLGPGSPEKRPYDVSRGQNQNVTLPWY